MISIGSGKIIVEFFSAAISVSVCRYRSVMAIGSVAITLRYLQTLTEIAAEKNSTIIFPLPIEMLHLLQPATAKS